MNAPATQPDPVLTEALRLAALGHRVLPIGPGKKWPLMTAWQDAATTDPAVITGWFTGLYRGHGLGVATGAGSGIWVLDVDVSAGKQGDETLADLEQHHGELPDTVEAETGTGGRHIWFRWPATGQIRNEASKNLGPGLDIRGTGGQVLVPPTLHPCGRPYQWIADHAPGDIPVADAPWWLLDMLLDAHRPTTPPPRPRNPTDEDDGPAARYNSATTWEQLLEADGWTFDRADRDGEQYWVRPGKERREGPSATVGFAGADALRVFSTSLPWLPEGAYSRFGYYACRWHGGDRSAAAKALYDAGYGRRRSSEAAPPPTEPPGWLGGDETYTVGGEGEADPSPWQAHAAERARVDAEYEAATSPAPVPPLVVEHLRVITARVDAAPAPQWLVEEIWPGDSYGVLAAEKKAGKTWGALDMGIAVASGTPWLDLWRCPNPGAVLLFLGEGGERKMVRRLRAIAAAKKVDLDELDIRVCFRVPHLTDASHLDAIRDEIEHCPPRLVVIDPMYLAARGAKASQLNEMGEHLENVQLVVQDAGAALAIIHHWNKTGVGKGSDRMSGVGGAEWGRILGSAAVRSKHTDPDTRATTVLLDWAFEGDEIGDTEVRVQRRVWADNPTDLRSALHYELVRIEIGPEDDDEQAGMLAPAHPTMPPSQRLVLEVLRDAPDWLTVHEIGDAAAATGRPLKAKTIRNALGALKKTGEAVPYGETESGHEPWSWRAAGASNPDGTVVAPPTEQEF